VSGRLYITLKVRDEFTKDCSKDEIV